MSKPPSALDLALREQLFRREARAELLNCLIFGGAALTLFFILSAFGMAREFHSFPEFRNTFPGYLGFAVLPVLFVRTGASAPRPAANSPSSAPPSTSPPALKP